MCASIPAPRTILITGASGYIGGELLRAFAQDGHTMHAIIRPNSMISRISSLPNVTLHTYDGSFAALAQIAEAVPVELIIHVAAHYQHPHTPEGMEAMLDANVRFGAQLAEAFTQQAHPPAFIYTGSYWQHGEGPELHPNSFYAASKSAFEQLLLYYVTQRGLRALTLKLGDVYGEADPDYKLFGLLANARRSGQKLPMTPGEQQMCLVHMDDVIAAYNLAMQHAGHLPASTHETYFVTGARYTLREVVTCYLERASERGEKSVEVIWGGLPYRPGQIMVPYSGKALPGWQPRVTLAQGIERMLHAT